MSNPNRVDPKQAYVLWSKGFCDADIAERLEVSQTCVGDWRRRNCLKANRANTTIPVEERGQISQEAWEARQAGMSYGEWKARQWEAAGRPKSKRIRAYGRVCKGAHR